MTTTSSPSTYFVDTRGTWTTSSGALIAFTGNTSMNTFGLNGTDLKVGQSNKDYKIQLAKGLNAATAYRRVINQIDPTRISFEARNNVTKDLSKASRSYYGTGSNFPAKTNDAALLDLALTRFKRKLKKQVGAIDLVTPTVELRDLHRTVKGMAALTTTALQTLIDIKRTRGRSAIKYASQAWLTYSFGMRPLMADTDAICKSIVAFLERKDHSVKLTGSASGDSVTRDTNFSVSAGTGVTADYYGYQLHKLSYRYVGAFNITIKSNNDYGLVEHFGLEPSSLIPALWELTAFSWVVDYFTTVGAYLDDTFWTLPGSTKYIVLCRRYIGTYIDDVLLRPSNVDWVITSRSLVKRGECKIIEFERTLVTDLPTQSLRFRSLDEVGKNGINKVLNLASVLGSTSKAAVSDEVLRNRLLLKSFTPTH